MIESAIIDITKCVDRSKLPSNYFNKLHAPYYYFKRAELYLLNNNTSAAMTDINTSISLNPSDWQTYNFRSNLLIKDGKLHEALIDLSKSIKLNDNEAMTFAARGMLRLKMGDRQGACNDLSKVLDWGFDEFKQLFDESCR